MLEILTFLKNNLSDHFVIYFLPLYILGGRPAAVLTAQLLGLSMTLVLPVVVLLDTLQIPLFHFMYDAISNRLFIRKLHNQTIRRERAFLRTRVFQWMRVLGAPGVVAIAMLPVKGCGMWSGVLLSKLLSFSKGASYGLLIGGSILGCAFLLGLGEAILHVWRLVATG